jgi:hypothetical protein
MGIESVSSGVSPHDVFWSDPPAEPELRDRAVAQLDRQTYGVCRDPESVIEGAICDDRTAVSDACRRAKPGSFDEYVCDDKKLDGVQTLFVEIAKKAIELILGARMSKL